MTFRTAVVKPANTMLCKAMMPGYEFNPLYAMSEMFSGEDALAVKLEYDLLSTWRSAVPVQESTEHLTPNPRYAVS